MEELIYDTIVIGAGINGAWTAYHLAKRGERTLLLEQVPIPVQIVFSHPVVLLSFISRFALVQ